MNQAILLIEEQNIAEGLSLLIQDIKNNILELKNMKTILNELKGEFFDELNIIGEKFGIVMENITENDIFKETRQSQYEDLNNNIKSLIQKKDNSFSKIIKNRR